MASLSSANNIRSVFQKLIFFIARITCTFIRIQEWKNEGPEVTHSQSGHLTYKSQKLLSLILRAQDSSSSLSPWNPALAPALSYSQCPFCPLSTPCSLILTPDSLVSTKSFSFTSFSVLNSLLYIMLAQHELKQLVFKVSEYFTDFDMQVTMKIFGIFKNLKPWTGT